MYEFASGPLVGLAFVIFILGMIYRLIQINSQIKILKKNVHKLSKQKEVEKPLLSAEEISLKRILKFKDSLLYRHPIMAIVSFVFHFCFGMNVIYHF